MEKTRNKKNNKSIHNCLLNETKEKKYSENDIFATIRVLNSEQVLKKKVITRKSKLSCEKNQE